LADPAIHLGLNRQPPDKLFGCIYLCHFLGEVIRPALRQLNHRVYTCSFQEFGVFFANAFDPEEVSVVDPLEDQLIADS
jgi:hypothetical protein